ncbi:hypothetical protein ACFL6N_01240 [Thermodesulfobacteriota bacterium]
MSNHTIDIEEIQSLKIDFMLAEPEDMSSKKTLRAYVDVCRKNISFVVWNYGQPVIDTPSLEDAIETYNRLL